VKRSLPCVLLAMMVGAAPVRAGEEDDPALTELVEILREKGVLDEAEYEGLAARAAREEARRDDGWWDRILLSGDFRARHESIFFQNTQDRHRERYRLRLSGRARIHDRAEVRFRIASGGDDPRSANQTLGSALDFDSDPIRIDRAYVHLTPFAEGEVPGMPGAYLGVEAGKLPNPYYWKIGRDFMLWDHDISLEGVTVVLDQELADGWDAFLRGGYYVIDENGTGKDPKLLAAQVGSHLRLTDTVTVGARASWYGFRSLNKAFVTRGAAGGNVPTGLAPRSDGGPVDVVAGTAYLECACFEDWPVVVTGTVATNLAAEATPGLSREDLAWGVNLEVGDKRKLVKLGGGYWYIESNAFPSMFIDSNLFDGFTNRHGFAFYGSRRILPDTDLNITTFLSDEIDDDGVAVSRTRADRVRLQVDLVYSF